MSDVSFARSISEEILKNSSINYGLEDEFSNQENKEKYITNLYEFLKWVYSGTAGIYAHYLLRCISGDGKKYFHNVFKQEAAWLLIGCTLPQQNDMKITVPDIIINIIKSRTGIELPTVIAVQMPHFNGDKLISNEQIDAAVEAYKEAKK